MYTELNAVNLKQFELQYPQQANHKSSISEEVSMDLPIMFTKLTSKMSSGSSTPSPNHSATNSMLKAPKLIKPKTNIGYDSSQDQELQLYELFKSFIDSHEQSKNRLTNASSSISTATTTSPPNGDIETDTNLEHGLSMGMGQNDHIFEENDIMSYNMDTLETPRSLNPNLSITTSNSANSQQLTDINIGDDIEEEDEEDFTQDEDEEYTLRNMDVDNVDIKEELNNENENKNGVDVSTLPKIDRLKSQTYWNRRILETQLNSARHRLTVSRQNIEQGVVSKMKEKFDGPFAGLENLPDEPQEFIRSLSNKTKIQITSTNRKKTTKARHKHKIKPKNAKKYNTIQYDTDSDNENNVNNKIDIIINKNNKNNIHNNIKPLPLQNTPSWRSIVNKQNSERCRNVDKVTPRSSLIERDYQINIERPALNKVSDLIKNQYKR